jgi:hypothetical protein
MNNCSGMQVRNLPIKLKDDALCVCNGYHESHLDLGGDLAGVARHEYSEYTMYAQSQEGSRPIITVYTCQQQQQSEKFTD